MHDEWVQGAVMHTQELVDTLLLYIIVVYVVDMEIMGNLGLFIHLLSQQVTCTQRGTNHREVIGVRTGNRWVIREQLFRYDCWCGTCFLLPHYFNDAGCVGQLSEA